MNACHDVPDVCGCLTETDSSQQASVPWQAGGWKPGLIGDWKVISILVFCVLQAPKKKKKYASASNDAESTRQVLSWAVNKQELKRDAEKESRNCEDFTVRPSVPLPACTPQRAIQELNTIKVNTQTRQHPPTRFYYSNAFRQLALFLRYELIYPSTWCPGEPLHLASFIPTEVSPLISLHVSII